MSSTLTALRALIVLPLICLASTVLAAEPADFFGRYSGSAELETAEGGSVPRDMSVAIERAGDGFSVSWSSTSQRADGVQRRKSYTIPFQPTERPGVYAAAMERNVFGHAVQLDPMKGEPYVWARIAGDTLSVFSLFVTADGGYEIQQFDRTLSEGGLELDFMRVRNGEPQRAVIAFLERE